MGSVTHILSTDIALKYYPSRANSVGLVKTGVEHYFEAGIEYIDGKLRDIIGQDDLIYDMHGLNARFYLKYRNNLCDD